MLALLPLPPVFPHLLQCDIMKEIDEHIMEFLKRGYIKVDFETGKIYTLRTLDEDGHPKELLGCTYDGYKRIHLKLNGKRKTVKAHRIVWIAKHGPIKECYHIDHINRDRGDNRLCNLRMVTPKINMLNRTSYIRRRQLESSINKDQQKVEEFNEQIKNSG